MPWSEFFSLAGSGVAGAILATVVFLVRERNSTTGRLIDMLMSEREKREARISTLESKVEELRSEVVTLKIVAATKEMV